MRTVRALAVEARMRQLQLSGSPARVARDHGRRADQPGLEFNSADVDGCADPDLISHSAPMYPVAPWAAEATLDLLLYSTSTGSPASATSSV